MIADRPNFLEEQLTQLETSYADALAQDALPVKLTMIWNKIKELRQKLEEVRKENHPSKV